VNKQIAPRKLALKVALCALFTVTRGFGDSNWGPYQSVSDGRDNRIYVRVAIGTFRYEGGSYRMTWQFRNDYSGKATFAYRVAHYDDKGKKQYDTGEETLAPGKESQTYGSWTIGDGTRGLEVTITKLRVETPSVIVFPGPKKK